MTEVKVLAYTRRLSPTDDGPLGLFDTSVSASALASLVARINDLGWTCLTCQSRRVYHADGLVMELADACEGSSKEAAALPDAAAVIRERLISVEVDASRQLLHMVFDRARQPYDTFPSDLQSLRAVVPAHRRVYLIAPKVHLIVEEYDASHASNCGTLHKVYLTHPIGVSVPESALEAMVLLQSDGTA